MEQTISTTLVGAGGARLGLGHTDLLGKNRQTERGGYRIHSQIRPVTNNTNEFIYFQSLSRKPRMTQWSRRPMTCAQARSGSWFDRHGKDHLVCECRKNRCAVSALSACHSNLRVMNLRGKPGSSLLYCSTKCSIDIT